jgi:hypothetical protein
MPNSVSVSRDEIQTYVDGRYVAASEACWRVFKFPLHREFPACVRLAIHLEGAVIVQYEVDNCEDGSENEDELNYYRMMRMLAVAWRREVGSVGAGGEGTMVEAGDVGGDMGMDGAGELGGWVYRMRWGMEMAEGQLGRLEMF